MTLTHKTLEAKHKGVEQVGTLPASRTRWRVGGAGSTGRWCGTRSPILSLPSRSIPFSSCTKSEDGTRINRDKALLEAPSRYSPFIEERFDQLWRFFRRSRFHQHQSGNHKDATRNHETFVRLTFPSAALKKDDEPKRRVGIFI